MPRRRIADLLQTIGVILVVLVFIALLVWGISEGDNREREHNQAQVAECRAMGGFARTNADGWLLECTFPKGAR